jgi:hypothetical protein
MFISLSSSPLFEALLFWVVVWGIVFGTFPVLSKNAHSGLSKYLHVLKQVHTECSDWA